MKKEQIVIIFISSIILIFGSLVIIKYSDYKKEQMIQVWKYNINQEQKSLDSKNSFNTKSFDLDICLNKAKENRNSLWEANCPKNDKNCSLDFEIIKWIEDRYNKEVDICIQRNK